MSQATGSTSSMLKSDLTGYPETEPLRLKNMYFQHDSAVSLRCWK